MSGKYTPTYPDPENYPDTPVVSGSARTNVIIEESAQRAVAENPKWMLARKLNSAHGNYTHGDSRPELEALGFTDIAEANDLFYEVTPPEGWTKSTSGHWTTVLDKNGEEAISQFFKGTWYDTDAFLNIK